MTSLSKRGRLYHLCRHDVKARVHSGWEGGVHNQCARRVSRHLVGDPGLAVLCLGVSCLAEPRYPETLGGTSPAPILVADRAALLHQWVRTPIPAYAHTYSNVMPRLGDVAQHLRALLGRALPFLAACHRPRNTSRASATPITRC